MAHNTVLSRLHSAAPFSHAAVKPSGSQRYRWARRASLVQPPPEDYDFRAQIQRPTYDIVQSRYPDLLDLVEEGTLVVYQRPADYTERRTDGYREPQEVFIVGTAHLSSKSAQDVMRVVHAVQPENVVVELCKSRTAAMADTKQEQEQQQQQQQQMSAIATRSAQQSQTAAAAAAAAGATGSQPSSGAAQQASTMTLERPALGPGNRQSSSSSRKASNPLSLSGASFLEAVGRALNLGGQSGLLLRVLLAGLADKAAKELDLEPGSEFRAARQAADAVEAQVVLGDRPIEITLERAWEALTWRRKLELCWALLGPGWGKDVDLTPDFIESLKSDDVLSSFVKELGQTFPELLGPLVHERDLYLAWSMKRSKAVHGTQRVVGVVGRGHLRGIVYAMHHDSGSLRFADLVGGKNTREYKQKQKVAAVGRLVVEILLGLGLYVAWENASAISQAVGL